MKAKELKEEARQYYYGYPQTAYDKGYFSFTNDEFKAFCEKLCKEQREICFGVIAGIDEGEFSPLIVLNAPTPDL